MIITSTTPSPHALTMLKALQDAVSKNLEKKQKLGQYVVTWENGHPVTKGADAPQRPS